MDTISIVGGSVAGLALAATLDPGRWAATLYERAPDRPAVGTALVLWPEVMAALEPIGVATGARRLGVLLGRLEVRDGRDRLLGAITPQGAYLINRPEVLGLLDAAVPSTVARVTRRVTSPDDVPAGVVVAADGVHSVIRRAMCGSRASARPVGYVAFRGISPAPISGMVERWQNGVICGLSQTASGETNWYLCVRNGSQYPDVETWGDDRAHAAASGLAARFGAEAVGIIEATPPAQVLRQQLWQVPPMLRIHSGTTVLIGDAAHAMCPNLGRGACESLLDAVSLGTALNELSVGRAIRRYRNERLLRAQATRAISRAVLSFSTMRHGAPLRDAVLAQAAGLYRRT